MSDTVMPDKSFTSLENRMSLHGFSIRCSLPAPRRSEAPDDGTKTSISRKIEALRNDCGMTLQAITSAINHAFGSTFSLATVHTWARGRTPRKISPDEIERVLDDLYDETEHIEGGAWVPADEIQRTVQGWRESMTIRQIAIAADENAATVSAWSMGNHAVYRPKWNRIVEEVNRQVAFVNQTPSEGDQD